MQDAGCTFPDAGPTTLLTDYGAVDGLVTDGGLAFLGVPFASSVRFQPATALACWSGTRPATTFPPACLQKDFDQTGDGGAVFGVEDCLFLNAWTPSTTGSRPVLVFIHGGGNSQGSTGQITAGARFFDGESLSRRNDAVIVTLQYRLGPLGFLVAPNVSNGNLGLTDQQAALRWVQAHAARLGGDPSRVMLFGESAGAVDTCMHLVMPGSNGLFSRALMQSGGCVARTAAERSVEGEQYLRDVGCDPNDGGVACLAALTDEQLLAPIQPPINGGVVQLAFGPAVDGDGGVLPEAPLAAISAGRHAKVPLVVGVNSEEMSLSAPTVVTPNQVRALYLTVPATFRAQMEALYPPGTTNAEARRSFVAALTDAQFLCPARRIARAASSAQTAPVYRYYFSHALRGPAAFFGAFHGVELFYVFASLEKSSYATSPGLSAGDNAVIALTGNAWGAFAASGNPSTTTATWPAYQASTDPYLELAAPPVAGLGLRTAECDFWDTLSP